MGWVSYFEDIDKRANQEYEFYLEDKNGKRSRNKYREILTKRTNIENALLRKQAGRYLESIDYTLTAMKELIDENFNIRNELVISYYFKQDYKNDSFQLILQDIVKTYIKEEPVRKQVNSQLYQFFLKEIIPLENFWKSDSYRSVIRNNRYSTEYVNEKDCELLAKKLVWLELFLTNLSRFSNSN